MPIGASSWSPEEISVSRPLTGSTLDTEPAASSVTKISPPAATATPPTREGDKTCDSTVWLPPAIEMRSSCEAKAGGISRFATSRSGPSTAMPVGLSRFWPDESTLCAPPGVAISTIDGVNASGTTRAPGRTAMAVGSWSSPPDEITVCTPVSRSTRTTRPGVRITTSRSPETRSCASAAGAGPVVSSNAAMRSG